VDLSNDRDESSGSTGGERTEKRRVSEGFRAGERLSGCFGLIQKMKQGTRWTE